MPCGGLQNHAFLTLLERTTQQPAAVKAEKDDSFALFW